MRSGPRVTFNSSIQQQGGMASGGGVITSSSGGNGATSPPIVLSPASSQSSSINGGGIHDPKSASSRHTSRTGSFDWRTSGSDQSSENGSGNGGVDVVEDHSDLRTHDVNGNENGFLGDDDINNPNRGYDYSNSSSRHTSSNGKGHRQNSATQELLNPSHNFSSDDDGHPTGHDEVVKSSKLSSVFVLAATTLGAGILGLPHAFSQLGWLFGTILLVAVGLLSSYAINLLLTTARDVNAKTYEELGDSIFPGYGKKAVVICTLVLIFGSLTAFFVIIADTVQPAVQNIVSNSTSFFVKREVLLILVAFVFILPLCLLKSIHALERWSFLAVGIILCFSILTVIYSIRKIALHEAAPSESDGSNPSVHDNIKAVILQSEIFQALPVICLAFTCQTMVFPIWNNLRKDPSVGRVVVVGESEDVEANQNNANNNNNNENDAPTGLASVTSMMYVVNRCLVICGVLYLVVSLFGFVAFGPPVEGDVLKSFPADLIFYNFVRLLFAVAIGIHYPVVHFGFRSVILTTWYQNYTEQENRRRFFIITLSCFLSSLMLALILPDLDTVFDLTGSLCAFPYCFMFPSAFYLRLHYNGDVRGWKRVRKVGEKELLPEEYDGLVAGDQQQHHQTDDSSPQSRLITSGSATTISTKIDTNNNETDDSSSTISSPSRFMMSQQTNGHTYLAISDQPGGMALPKSFSSSSSSLPALYPPLTRWQAVPAIVLFFFASAVWGVSIVICVKAVVQHSWVFFGYHV